MRLFTRKRSPAGTPVAPVADLGGAVVAVRLDDGISPPAAPSCIDVVFGAGGQARRAGAPAQAGETAWRFHCGPYQCDFAPFAAAPELGLRTRFVIDGGDPRLALQRFDLYLFSEAAPVLTLADFSAAIGQAVQMALAQRALDLPPCTSVDEWHAFRAGFNQLLYTRFGVTVDDCVPADLAPQADFAAVLRARGQQEEPEEVENAGVQADAEPAVALVMESAAPGPAAAQTLAAPVTAAAATANKAAIAATAHDDARALRRLFLELPPLAAALRLLAPPAGRDGFLQQRAMLQRFALSQLDVDTMPSLAWATPDRPLPAAQQAQRARASTLAVAALDEAWALLARLQVAAAPDAALYDEADRIAANLELALARRRAIDGGQAAEDDNVEEADTVRKEPRL